MRLLTSLILAALLTGAAAFSAVSAWAGSCCGGGSATSLIVPKFARAVADISFDTELYDGFWNQDGKHIADPAGSDLKQYRVNLGYAHRFFKDWQASVSLPYLWNENKYSGLSSKSNGLGDATLAIWYDAVDDKSAWKVREPADLIPGITAGVSVLIPFGISPYDDIGSSFDVTGRGFYRMDGNLLIDKSLQPWSTSLALSYGTYFERAINREYGKFVEPYHRQLGDRFSLAPSVSYTYYLGSGGDTLTGTVSYSYLHEDDGTINGKRDNSTGFQKQAIGASVAFGGTDRDWSARVGFSHAVKEDGWGRNFPTTNIFTVGVRYVFR